MMMRDTHFDGGPTDQDMLTLVAPWALTTCHCDPQGPTMRQLVPGEQVLRCFECLKPRGRLPAPQAAGATSSAPPPAAIQLGHTPVPPPPAPAVQEGLEDISGQSTQSAASGNN